MKNQKGVTLIALVVTIIVLLILAGVSIAMLTGDNGLLTKAKEAQTAGKYGALIDSVNTELTAIQIDALAGKYEEVIAPISPDPTIIMGYINENSGEEKLTSDNVKVDTAAKTIKVTFNGIKEGTGILQYADGPEVETEPEQKAGRFTPAEAAGDQAAGSLLVQEEVM